MSVARDIEQVADNLRSLASQLRRDPEDPDRAALEIVSLANDLDDLARKVKRLARQVPKGKSPR